MKQKIKQSLMAIVGLLLSTSVFAHDFEVDGIYYNYIDETAKTVEVTYKGSYYYSYDNEYTGSVTIPSTVTYNGTTYSVTSIGYSAFCNCTGLTSVTIPNSVTSIGNYAFTFYINGYGYYKLPIKKTIWLTNTPPSGYTNAAGAINYVANDQYSSLSNVKVYPYLSSIFEVDGVKYVPVSPSERTCDAIDCSYNSTDSIINISNTISFKGVSMTVKDINPYTYYNNNYIKECKIDCNGNIGEYAFYSCDSIENLTLTANNIYGYAFSGCSAIKTIKFQGNSLKTIGKYAFNGCNSLLSIDIPNTVTDLSEYAFSGCSSLQNIKIGSSVMSINKNAFTDCKSLYSIDIPKNVESIGDYVFDNCTNLTNLLIEDRDSVLTLGSNGSYPLFSDCPLDSVYIGGNISYNTSSSYGYSPFYDNKTLRAITITDKETEISENEFYGCANLKRVKIGDGVVSIGNWAFSGCSSLETFEFGTSMKTIGEEAFSDCTALVKLRSKAMTPPTCGTQALDDINKWNCELFVPKEAIPSYQSADQWKEFFFISPDGVENIEIDGSVVQISIINGNIIINGIENPQVELYNINGQCVYCGNETSIPVSINGIYIIKINGKSYKIAI